MPTKKPAIHCYPSQELKDKFTATAKENNRSESNMLIEVLESYYKNKAMATYDVKIEGKSKISVQDIYEKVREMSKLQGEEAMSPEDFNDLIVGKQDEIIGKVKSVETK